MTRVFDASAILAAPFEEPGTDRVVELWAEGENLLLTVNYSAVVARLAERGPRPLIETGMCGFSAPAW